MSKSKYKVGDIVENKRDRTYCCYLLTHPDYVIAYEVVGSRHGIIDVKAVRFKEDVPLNILDDLKRSSYDVYSNDFAKVKKQKEFKE